MAELQVPIKLYIENLQSLIGDLQSKLSSLKIGSAGFKSLQSLINSMKNELDKLQIQGSKPFVDASQFTKAEHSVGKLEEQLQKVEMTLGRLKFNDLELSPNQKADLQAFEDQINSIKTNLKSVKDTAKQDFLGSALGKVWQEQFDSTAITKSFSQITTNIRAEVNKQTALVEAAKQAVTSYQNAMKANNNISNFLKNKNPLEESNLGVEKYAQIFQNTAKGLRFRSGGKSILEEWLRSQLQLDDATIKSLVEGSAVKVKAELENRLKALQISNKDIIAQNGGASAEYDAQAAKLEQLISIMQQLGASEQMVNTVEQALRQQLTGTSRAMQEYQDNAVNAARGNMEFWSTSSQMKSQLESLRGTLQQTNAQFIQLQRTQQSFNQMKMAVVNFMGFNQVLNITRNAIKNAINHIKELDTVMNNISIVTDMSTSDLWDQVDAYSKMAQSYGVSIKGAYEVSQIYYQQGLQTADVLTLTNETLKLAKISGLDYATTTDYMTTALRGFKMEMSEASTVVDVYSNLAAHTAVSQEELAVAMSKTASSMESVGATFEEASAMIGTMVAVTRESATNIGSAMKSIASRYGELTKDPTKLVDGEGEAMAFNKVDTALQSVGISMKTVDGQFREFTDVIIELGEKWDQLDSTQQRYIATQFAGNRQQSRFLALVSNVDLLKSNLDVAMNSEDTGTLQALKALDSIEAKTEQVRVAYQQFYTTIGAENVWKGFLDGAKNVINILNSFPKLFGKLPIAAIVAVTSIVDVIKKIGVKAITGFAEIFGNGLFKSFSSAQGSAAQGAEGIFNSFINTLKSKLGIAEITGQEIGKAVTKGMNTATGQQQMSPDKLKGIDKDTYDKNLQTITSFQKNVSGFAITDPEDLNNSYQNLAFNMQRTSQLSSYVWQDIQSHPENAQQILEQYIKKLQDTNQKLLETGNVASVSGNKLTNIFNNAKFGKGLESFGSALNMIGMMIDTSQPGMKTLSGSIMSIGGAASLAGIGIQAMNGALNSIPWMAIASGVFAIINGLSTLIITPEEKLEELATRAEELSNKAKESKAEYRTLDNSIKKLDELKEKRYESAEAAEEYQTAVDDLAEKFPEMISGFDDAGNIIITTTSAENVLTEARKKAAQAAADAAKAEYAKAREEQNQKKNELVNGWQQGNASAGLEHYTRVANGPMYDPSSMPLEVKKALVKLYPFIAHNAYGAEQDITSKEGQNQLKALGEILYKPGIEKEFNDTSVLDTLRESYSAMIQANSDYQELANISEAYAKQIVSAWTISQDANNHVWTFLYNSTGALAMVTDAITNDIVTSGLEVNDENARIMDSRGNYRDAMNNFISSLSKERLELFNKMYDASNIYSAEDFKTEFSSELNWSDTVYDIITGYYNESQTAITERLQNSLKQERTFIDKNGVGHQRSINEFYTEYENAILTATSQIQEQLLNGILSQYHNLASEGFVSQAIENGKQALKVFSKIKEIEDIDPQVYGSLVSSISNFNLNTKEGIDELIDYIDSTDTKVDDSLKEPLNDLKETLFSNVSLTIQSITDEIVNGWSDNSKILSKLTSGLDLSDVNSVITQAKQYDLKDSFGNAITIDFQDFQSNEGKLILNSEKANAYWDAFFSSQEKKITNVETDLDNAMKQLTGSDLKSLEGIELKEVSKEINNETAELFKTILGADFSKYFEAIIDEKTQEPTGNFKILNNEELSLNDAIIKAYKNNRDLISQYYQYIAWQRAEIETSYERSQGIYKLNNTTLSSKQLSMIAQGIDLSGNKLEKTAFTERAIKNQINSVYDTLISDVLSKGFENINLADYEGLIANTNINLSGKYEDFVNNYVDFTGKTIDEINDLILQAREKDREKVSEDLIKDVTFISDKQAWVDEATLGQLANAFNIPLQNLLNSSAVVWNKTLNQYAIDIEKLKNEGIPLDSIDNFSLLVQESIEGLFENLASKIKSALSGSLDLAGKKDLEDTLETLGIKNLNLQFTKTTDGLKLAVQSAKELYFTIRDIDALQGEIVFDELKESLIESDDHFKSMSSTLAYIRELEESIKSPDNSQRIDDLNKELELAQKINAERSTSEDSSYKFMDNKIPAAQNNPLNYWSSWADAFDKIKTSMQGTKKSKNTIGYEDFYNIVTEMGNIASLTDKGITWGQQTLHNSEEAANLIEQAAGALKNVDGKMVVDLSKIKMNVDTSGIQNMTKDVDAAVDIVADEQIKMLDSLISLLEVIVAMEQLKDIDADFDGELDLSEIFEDWDVETGDPKKFTDKMSTAAQNILDYADSLGENSDLYKALDSVNINGYTIREILDDATDGIKNLDISAEQYQAAIDALYQAMLSNDYDLDNIGESLMNILSSAGLDSVAIDVGTKTYYLVGKNQYIVDWENKDAIAAAEQALKDAGIWDDTKDVKDNIQTAINQISDEDYQFNVDLEYAISLATGKVSINKVTKGEHKGQFEGNYNGQKFYLGDEESVAKVIKQALNLENEGFTVKIDEKANIDANYSQGKTNIKYDTTTGEYIVNGEFGGRYSSLKEAIKDQVSKGFANETDVGAYDIKGKNFEVAYSAELQAAYSIWHSALNGDTYYYNGQQFSNYNDLITYVSAINLTQNKKQWDQSGSRKTGKETFTYKKNGEIKVIIDYSSGEPKITYEAFGKSFTDLQDIAKLTEIQNLVTASENQGGEISLNEITGNIEAQFVYDGMLITATINANGEFTYTFTDTVTGTTIEASSLSALKSAIAGVLGKNADGSNENSGTIKVNGVKFTYEMDAEGHIVVKFDSKADDETATDEEIEQWRTDTEKQLNQKTDTPITSDQPVTITASAINLTLADGATVTMGALDSASGVTKPKIASLEAEVENLTVTAVDKVTAGDGVTITNGDLGTINADNAVAVLSQLGINSITALYTAAGMTLPESEQDFGTITSTNVVAALAQLAINKVNSLINNATMPEAQDWGSIVADVSATLSSLNITGVDNFKLSIAAMLQTAGKQLTIPAASAIISQLNILNTTGALKSNETFTVTDITNAEGEASTLTITKITGDKTVTDLSNIKAGSNISAHAEGEATVTADSYRLDWTTIDSETGEVTVQSITVPADLKFGDADSLQAYLDTNPGSVEVSTQLNDTVQEQLNQKTYTVSITPQYDSKNPYTESYDENGNKTVKFNYQPINQSTSKNAIAPDTIDTKQIIHPEGQVEEIPDFDTTQTINTIGGVKEIKDFTTTQTIVTKGGNSGGGGTNTNMTKAAGNIGLARAKGTLMGELGPELVVSNGRYFVAGQNGAEMVDLADDAIVFNHLQTEQLLKHGMSSGRGRAVTNERNAVAFATGNMEGPAMASASAALNALKQLRAMWESLRSASVSDLAGGGGGGGGGGGDKIVDPRAWIDTVERWYNLTQKIDLLEKDITHQQQLREKINSDFQKSGTAYYNSQRQSLKDLQEEIAAQEQLNISRQEYLNARVENLKKTPLGRIYSMDENGQFSWNNNTNFRVNGRTIKGGHDFLENLYGFDDQKAANYTNKQKYDILIANGFADYMRTSANGEAIKADSDNDGQISEEEWESYYEAATEAFRDKMDEYKETTQDLADKVQEGKDQILKKQQEANELMREMRDNQIAVEDNVLKAIEESRQREIDKLQDLRDAIEDSNQAYLDGLNKALENERDLYSQNESADELNRLRRQRDILTRSGGSASQIAQLNEEIAQKSQDAYFEAQQQQIDALQEASDLQLERLDNQIDIMTQTLEYQKEFGLLWGEVYNVMAKSPADIAAFLAAKTSEYWAQSPVKSEDTFREWLFQAQQWDSFKTDLADTKSIVANMYDLTLQQQMDKDYKTFNDQMVALHGANYDSSGKYKQAFYDEYRNSRDISKATQVAQSAYTADENARKAAAAAQAQQQQQYHQTAQAQPAASGTGNVTVVNSFYVSDGESGCHIRQILSNGHANNLNKHPHTYGSNGKCTKCGYAKPTSNNSKTPQNEWAIAKPGRGTTITKNEDVAKSWMAAGKAVMSKFDDGGMVDEDQIALVHAKEGVLTAKQTSTLRNDILGNKPDSLMNLLLTFKQAYQDNPVSSIAQANSSGIIIENATVNMNVQQLANDYDARRAGEQALSEMLRIARKTSANNSIRR